MRKDLAAAATGVFLVLSGTAFAADLADGETLTKINGCFACHAVDRKIVGPAYREVAARYAGDDTAVATLVNKIKTGGKGVWGDVPMPAHPHLKDEDIGIMAQWILSTR